MHDDDQLDSLLARGKMSRPQKERVLDNVLESLEAEKKKPAISGWKRWWPAAALGLAASAAAMIFVVPSDDGFRAKGSGPGAWVEAGCDGACRPGSTLMFEVVGAEASGFLAAWAESHSGERTWFFPAAGGEMPAVVPSAAPAVLPRGVSVGASLPPGTYRVHLSVLPQVSSREAIAAGVVARWHGTQTLTVEP